MNARVTLSVLSVLMATAMRAQDIHFTQYANVPLGLNPGLIGQFNGDFRAHSAYRQQWRSVTVPYRTFAVGGDARDFKGIKGLGIGAWLFNDRAGDSRLNQFHFSLGASWTERFGNGDVHGVTIGAQLGITSLTFDNGGLSFDQQYNGFYYDPDRDNGEGFSRYGMVHEDVNAGIVYRFTPAARKLFQAGFAMYNLTKPGIGFLGEPDVLLDQRTDVHMLMSMPLNDVIDLMPMMRWMAQGEFREVNVGGNLRYILMQRYGLKRAVLAGLHGRALDAMSVYAGFEYDDWSFGASYDVNTSALVPASRNRGAIEFTVMRIWRRQPAVAVRFKACPEQL